MIKGSGVVIPGWFQTAPVTDVDVTKIRGILAKGGLDGTDLFVLKKNIIERLLDTREGLLDAISSLAFQTDKATLEQLREAVEFSEAIAKDCRLGERTLFSGTDESEIREGQPDEREGEEISESLFSPCNS